MTLDCYLRLRLAELEALRFEHLESGADQGEGEAGAAAHAEAAIAIAGIEGYTEWVSTAPVAHSIGWDWHVRPPQGALVLRAHSIRTNIMLLLQDGTDAGRAETERAIAELIERWNWAETVLAAVQGSLGALPKVRSD